MPQKKQPTLSVRAVIDRISDELTEAIAAEVERRVAEAISLVKSELKSAGIPARASSKAETRTGVRLCPAPGCNNPGAGPRNRWFCKDHARKFSVSEMKAILERNKRLHSEGKLPTKVTADKIVRVPAKKTKARRTLDMNCRVEGCGNRSRGPRVGFICDLHRAQLSPEEQVAAREAYKARNLGKTVEAPRPALPPAPVPPIVRKAETAEA